MHAEPAASVDPVLVEGLGMLGSGSVAVFLRLAKDAQHAPATGDLLTLTRMAAGELSALDLVEQGARRLGVDLEAAMTPFRGALVELDARTRPSDWWERVVKTYVGYGVIRDFQHGVWSALPAEVREDLTAVAHDSGYGDYVVGSLAPVLAEDRQLAARLALWGRRVTGDALTAVRQLLSDHPLLVPQGTDGARMLAAVTARHAGRMNRLGLTA